MNANASPILLVAALPAALIVLLVVARLVR